MAGKQNYAELAKTGYEEAFDLLERAKNLLKAYLVLYPENLTNVDLKVIVGQAQEIGELGNGLKVRAKEIDAYRYLTGKS